MKRQYKQDIINIVNDERKRVVSERRALGYTQTDVARFSGCTSQNVSSFENGKNDSLYLYMSYIAMCYQDKGGQS